MARLTTNGHYHEDVLDSKLQRARVHVVRHHPMVHTVAREVRGTGFNGKAGVCWQDGPSGWGGACSTNGPLLAKLGLLDKPGLLAARAFAGGTGFAGGAGFSGQTGHC